MASAFLSDEMESCPLCFLQKDVHRAIFGVSVSVIPLFRPANPSLKITLECRIL